MNLPWVVHDGDGTTTQFNVPFPYLREGHVYAKVDGNPVNYTWINSSRIEISPAPAAGKQVVIMRLTPSLPLYTVQNGQPIPAEQHNEMLLQVIYRSEEKEVISLVLEMQQLLQQVIVIGNDASTAAQEAEAARIAAEAAAASANAIAGFDPSLYLKRTGGLITGEINSRASTALRFSSGDATTRGAVLHKNTSDFVILLTDAENKDGVWNSLRPFTVKLHNGRVLMGCGLHVTAGDVTFSGSLLNVAGRLDVDGEIWAKNVHGIRFISGAQAPAVIVRKDSSNFYLMLTDAGDRLGTFNAKRPFHFNLASGRVGMSEGLNVANGLNVTSGVAKVGTAWLHDDGNINGSIWKDWHPDGWIKGAIDSRITTRMNAQASGILDGRLAGTAVVSSKASDTAAKILPSGYVATAIRMKQVYEGGSGGGYSNTVELHGKQVQVNVPGTGWRGVASV